MKYKRLGKSGLKVSQICLGTLDFGLRISEADGIKLIKSAKDEGINFLDTSNSYPKNNKGMAETIIGKAIKEDRHSFVVASKVYGQTGEGPNDKGLSRKHITKCIEGTLKRLQTEYLDIYFLHHPDPDAPLEETLRTLDDLVHQGKVLYIGCSNYTTWQLCKALSFSDLHNLARFVVVEPPYNLLTRDIEIELAPFCKEEGIGVCVYSPMASELLSGRHEFGKLPKEGRFTDKECYGEFSKQLYWSEINFKAVDQFKKIVMGLNLSLPQFSLAWVLSNETITSAISGPINIEQLKENVSATEVTLPPEALQACDEVWEMFRVPRKFYAQDGDGRDLTGRWGWERPTVSK
jgi:aryl-alcohol dehydrogenase-like predicted oxidoreductase